MAASSLVCNEEFYQPQSNSALIYISSEDVNIELAKIEAAGVKIFQDKKLIAEGVGYMGVFIDTEGNKIALHSRS